jgi:serine/threonine-protein kinase RsbW
MELLSNMKLPTKLEYLGEIMSSLSHCDKKHGFSAKRISEIAQATEEVLVNIFRYAYHDEIEDVEVTCKLGQEGRLIIEIVDSGVPFDMLSLGEPDTTADISERKVGGLGIFLIRKLMDDVQYEHEGAKNVLSLIVNKDKGKG